MPREQILQWDKTAGETPLEVRLGRNLPAGITLTSVTSVVLEEKTDDDPPTWTDRTAQVVVTGSIVADDDVNNVTAGAVQFRISEGADPATPIPGREYRIKVRCVRSDTYDEVGTALLRVMG